jgi:hypothetical protein
MIPALLITGGTCLAMFLLAGRERTPAVWRPETAQGLAFEVPANSGPGRNRPGEPWKATEFRSAVLGDLRIAQERPRGDLDPAVRDWFELPGDLDRPLAYTFQGRPAQARPMTGFGRSAWFVTRSAKGLQAVLVFDLAGRRYWVQTRSAGGDATTLAAFRHVLGSLRGPGGEDPGPGLVRELEAAQAGLPPGFLQDAWPSKVILLLPPVALLAAFGINGFVLRSSGRAPSGSGSLRLGYQEAHVEICLVRRFQRKWFDAALAVDGDRLVVYTFGTPFLSVGLASLAGRVTEGRGWFGDWLELDPALPFQLEKNRFFYNYLVAPGTRLRVTSQDLPRLRLALGAP